MVGTPSRDMRETLLFVIRALRRKNNWKIYQNEILKEAGTLKLKTVYNI
jgi:hypothetical protein